MNTTGREVNTINKKLVSVNHLNLLTYISNEINTEYGELIDCILFSNINIVHPSTITPTQLISELKSNTKLLNGGKEFPVSLIEEHSFILLEMSYPNTYYPNNKLIFVMSIPLPFFSTTFYLYWVVPLPIPRSNTSDSSYFYLQPRNEYISEWNDVCTYELN